MITLHGTNCCGMGEIADLSTAKTPLEALHSLEVPLRKGYDHFGSAKLRPFIVFTAVTTRVLRDHASGRGDDYGQSFADFLEKNGLGPVVKSHERPNWTKNGLTIFIWHPEYDKVWKYLEEHP